MKTSSTLLGMAVSICLVASSHAAPIVVDIASAGGQSGVVGVTGSGTAIHYNVLGYHSSVGNMTDTSGTLTGIGLTFVAGRFDAYNSVAAGYITGPAASIFPDAAARSFIAAGTPKSSFMRWRLDGLRNDRVYDFAFFPSREGTGDATSTFTVFGANTLSGSLNARGNTGQLLYLNGAVPNSYGSLEFRVGFGSTSTSVFAYFNGFQVTERVAPPTAVPEPGTGALSLVAMACGLCRLRRGSRNANAQARRDQA